LITDLEAKMVNNKNYKGYIRTFSQFVFIKDNEKSEKDFPGAKKALDIFKNLLTNYGHKVQKTELCEIFWPDMSEEKAKQNLSSNLYYLRKGLDKIFEKESFGKFFIRSNSHVCWLNKPPEMGLDFEVFEELIEQGDSQSNQALKKRYYFDALEIYTGDYLPFSNYNWAIRKRKEYQEKAIHVILKLIGMDDVLSENEKENLFEKGFSIAPLNEVLVLKKLEFLRQQDKVLDIIKVFKDFKNRLESEVSIAVPREIELFMADILKRNTVSKVPNEFKAHQNYVEINELQKLISFELNARNPKTLLLSVNLLNGLENQKDIKKMSEHLFRSVRGGDRISYSNNHLFILFTEIQKIDLPSLIERFYPYFEKYFKETGAKYKWHEIKHKKTKLITYGEWK